MRRLAWAPLLLVPLVVPAHAVAHSAVRCSGVVNVSQTPGRGEGEESLSVNPRNPREIMIGSNQFEPAGPGLPVSAGGLMEAASWVSRDGGCTWHATGLETLGGVADVANPSPVGPPEFRHVGNLLSTDQSSVWDRHGNLVYEAGFLGGVGVQGDQRAEVWRSTDGGRTFGQPVVAYDGATDKAPPGSAYPDTVPELDRPWLAVDRSGGPRDGTVYMTLATGPFALGLPAEVYVVASPDGGRTWGSSTRVDTGTYTTQMNPREIPAVGGDGALYIAYDVAPSDSTVLPVPQVSPISVYVARSTDGGRTFARSVVDTDVHRVTDPDEALPVYTETITAIAADPVHRGHLAVASPEADAAGSHIVVRTSADGGRTWSARRQVGGPTVDQQDHVTLTYTPRGQLVVVWRSHPGGSWSDPFQIWAAELGHHAEQVTTGLQQPTTLNRGGPIMPSEFMGAAATSHDLLVSWDQLDGSLPDNMFRAVPLAQLR